MYRICLFVIMCQLSCRSVQCVHKEVSANIQPINTALAAFNDGNDRQRAVVVIQTDVTKFIQKTQSDNAERGSNIQPRPIATRQEIIKNTENNAANRYLKDTVQVTTPGNGNIVMDTQNENVGLVMRSSFVEQTRNRKARPNESTSQQIQRTGRLGNPMEEWLLTSQNIPYIRNQHIVSADATLKGDMLRNNGRNSATLPNLNSVYLGDIPMNIELHVQNNFYVLPQSRRSFSDIPIITSSEGSFNNRARPSFQYFPPNYIQLLRNTDYNGIIYPYDMSDPRNTEGRRYRPSFQGYIGFDGSTLPQSLRYPAGIGHQNNRRILETNYAVPSNRRPSNIYTLGRSVLFQSYEPY